jgi:hypothetical protein
VGSALGKRTVDEIDLVLARRVIRSFGVGRANNKPVDHPCSTISATRRPSRSAGSERWQRQLGTVGAGNHYLDLFADEDGWGVGRRPLRLARCRECSGDLGGVRVLTRCHAAFERGSVERPQTSQQSGGVV